MQVEDEQIAIVGVGNLLLQDDGVGVHAIRMLADDPPDGVTLIDAGTAFLTVLGDVEEADRILVIDSMKNGAPAGSIYLSSVNELAASDWRLSMHQLGFLNALSLMAERKERHILVLGVEAGELNYGMELSGAVSAALPAVVAAAKEIVSVWRRPIPRPATEVKDGTCFVH